MSGVTSLPVCRFAMRFVFRALALGTALFARPLPAQEMEIPVATQISLFLKVIAFDRRLSSPATDVVIVVAFQSGNRPSTVARDEVIRAVAALPADERRMIRTVTIDLDDEDLRAILREHRATMLYVTPLRGLSIGDIAGSARAAQVSTFTGVPKYLAQGLAVGVRRVGDRPKLMVNLRAAKLEGADFSAELLKLVQVVN